MRRNNKQLIAVLLAAAMVFTGCAPAASTGDTSGTGATETAAAANADTAEVQTEETEAAEGQSGDETSVLEALAEENPEQEDPNPVVYDDGTPWLDTSLYLGDDSIMPEESSAADDFYYYVNKEFLEDAEKRFNPNGITISELSEANPFDFEGYAALIDDESNTSDAARIMREITSITTSQKANAKGVQEASVFLTDLDQVETLDQLTDFIVSHPYYMFDSEHYVCYQIYGLTLVAYGKDSKDITKTAAGFDNIKLILKDTSEYEERTSIGANEELNAGTLLNAGYAWMLRYDLDPSKDLADTLDIEKRYMEGIDSQDAYAMDYYEKSYNPVTQEELASKYSAYPFAQIAANLTHDVEILIDCNPAFCANLDKLYTEENLDILKESIRVQYVLNTLQLMSFSGYYYANTIRNFDYPRYHVTVTNPSAGEEEAPAAAATGEESAQYATEEPTLGAGTDMELTEEEAAEASTEMPAPQGEEETVFPYHDQLLEVLKENYGSDDMAQAFTADACANIYYEPLTQLVAEKVDSAQMKTDVDEMCRNIIKEYHGIINRQEWLSDETRAKAIEKIDNMTVRTLFPNSYSDMSGLSFEGLSYYGVFQKLIDTSISTNLYAIRNPGQIDLWPASPLLTNAFYSPDDNSINICYGIMGGSCYAADAEPEKNYGAIGTVIGHEISHAFDPQGAQFDKEGNMASWWTDEDFDAFNKRIDKMVDYFNNMVAFDGLHMNGPMVKGEVSADVTGLKAALETLLAVKPDADLETFYRQYASIWASKDKPGLDYYSLKTDEHPLGYQRVNVSVMQNDSFFETFGIKEGDNMYMAPEDRIAIWE